MVLGVNSRLPVVKDIISATPFGNVLYGSWKLLDHKTNDEIVTFDTFLGYDFSNDSNVPVHAIEKGSFTAYNKINNPSGVSVQLCKSGLPFELRNILEQLDEYLKTTTTIDVVLPFKTLVNYTIIKMNHSIKENGSAGQLVIELGLQEIKEASVGYSYVKRAGGLSGVKDTGKTQVTEAKEKSKSILKRWIG